MALNRRIILIGRNDCTGLLQRLIEASKEQGHDVIFVDSQPVEREYKFSDLPSFGRLIEPPELKFKATIDRTRIQDRWGRYK